MCSAQPQLSHSKQPHNSGVSFAGTALETVTLFCRVRATARHMVSLVYASR